MLKTLKTLLRQDREKFVISKGVQDIIPVMEIYKDGIFKVGKDKYSKSYKFTDINFAVASYEEMLAMLQSYADFLNSLDSGVTTQININNRHLNQLDFKNTILMQNRNDNLDEYHKEYNQMLFDKSEYSNFIIQEKYVTVSVYKKSVENARAYFNRFGAELSVHLNRLGSICTEMDINERLRIFHDFFRVGEESYFYFDMEETEQKGHSFKDYICPDSMEFKSDYFKYGERYGRVLFIREYGSSAHDDVLSDLTELNDNMMLSVDIVPIPTEEALKEIDSRMLGAETDITNWQRRQNQNNNFSAVVPYQLEQKRKSAAELMEDVSARNQKIFLAIITIVHTSDSKEQLDNDTEALKSISGSHHCQLGVMKFQQLDGLTTVLPYGKRKIDVFRTLKTESLAIFAPFKVQEIYHKGGIYYGQNVISQNMIIADRKLLLNGNSFILGVSGGGKSFMGKSEIVALILNDPNADVIIIDPEREYSALVKALFGEVIQISAVSENHINAMDLNAHYGDEINPIAFKSEFLMSLFEELMVGAQLEANQKSIIDRCSDNVYRSYIKNNYTGTAPTLKELRQELLKQPEKEAHNMALALELFTDGSLDVFAKETNVNTDNRLICYDILDLGKQLQSVGMLVVLDSILNRITQNRAKGRNTYIFIDEIYLLFQREFTASFLSTLWKRVRKYGAYCTGITQYVSDLLQSNTAQTMLANSEFIVMLNQAATDRIKLAELLNISETQLTHITNVPAGCGLLKIGNSLIPFENKFPKNTNLYKLMRTKFGESQ